MTNEFPVGLIKSPVCLSIYLSICLSNPSVWSSLIGPVSKVLSLSSAMNSKAASVFCYRSPRHTEEPASTDETVT